MTGFRRTVGPAAPYRVDTLAPGVTVRRLHPGGMAGPNGEVQADVPGGQTWSEAVLLGAPEDDFVLCLPDIRMPPNQFWPMHWHDCWTVVVILEGNCAIGDWYMAPGDVFVAAPSVEYGPLLPGPRGTRLLEIFGDLARSAGGYAPEYRDHPTLQGGTFAFHARTEANRHNEGRSSLPLEGAAGLWKTQLAPGWQWDLGATDDPDRGVVRDIRLAPGETIAARAHGDWYAALVLDGTVEAVGRKLERNDVLIAERDAALPAITGGAEGAHLLELFRTARAL